MAGRSEAGEPSTLFDKVWDGHVVAESNGASLLWIDRHFVHEGSHHAFAKIAERGVSVAEPELTFGVADHYVPVRAGAVPTSAVARMIATLTDNTKRHGITLFGSDDPRQGIVHVVGPEQGITLPGTTIVCGDSHTSTHGAFGALAFGIGATDVAHVLATQTMWKKRPKTMRMTVSGTLAPWVSAKDLALSWIATLGADGAQGYAIEYTGSAIEALSMEARLTLCNLSIEGGARCGMIAPDDATFAFLEGRPYAPRGGDWDAAVAHWRELHTDDGAVFDREVSIDGGSVAPTVTWGTSPEDALPITAAVPSPHGEAPERAHRIADALDYMGLKPGEQLSGLRIDRVFIGSCTNARIEDLRAAAAVLSGRTVRVPGLVSPGSSLVKRQAEEEGLAEIFEASGLTWAGSGCSMCVGMNGDTVQPGERCASTTNRNFRGRQGPGARTHLMSPAMVAAAAVAGALTDVRPMLEGRSLRGAA